MLDVSAGAQKLEKIQSYAYDLLGKKVPVWIVEGKTFLENGFRLPVGYTVQTQGGIYKMTDSGGVKVDYHNRYIANVTEPAPVKQYDIPFTGSNILGGNFGEFLEAFKNQKEGTLTPAQIDEIAKNERLKVLAIAKQNEKIEKAISDLGTQELVKKYGWLAGVFLIVLIVLKIID